MRGRDAMAGLLAGVTLLVWAPVAGAACPPAAKVVGEGPLADEVRELLVLRGIPSEGDPECPVVLAQIESADGAIRVQLSSSGETTEMRTVSDTVTAATVIESWVRSDIEQPLIEGAEMKPTPPATTPTNPKPTPLAIEPPAANSVVVSTGAAVFVSRGDEASVWVAPEVSSCLSVGPVCAGALVRGEFDTRLSGSSVQFDTSRLGADVLIAATLPVQVGKLSLAPTIGAGAGWLRHRFNGEEAGTEKVVVDTGGVRLEARAALRVPIARRISAEFAMRFGLSPLARRTLAEEGFELAGEPLWSAGLGAGVRFGGN